MNHGSMDDGTIDGGGKNGGVNDESLVLYYYDDGLEEGQRAAVEAALARDPSLRSRYRALCASLAAYDRPAEVAAPGHMTARWQRAVDRAAAGGARRDGSRAIRVPAGARWHLPSFAWGALAAVVVLGVAAGFLGLERQYPEPPAGPVAGVPEGVDPATAGAPTARAAAFSRGLEVHLRESRDEIMGLAGLDAPQRTSLLLDILRQNRLFERAAAENGAEDVARVLRAFEPVLLRLATATPAPADAEALRSRLAFELGVVLTKMGRTRSDDTQSI